MTVVHLSQRPTGPPMPPPGTLPLAAVTPSGVPAGEPNAPANGFAGVLSALLGTPGTPPAAQTKPFPARPLSKRQPGDDPAVTSLAAALLPPVPTPPAPTAPVEDDPIGTDSATSVGLPAGSSAEAANLLDSAPAAPAPSAQEAAAGLVQESTVPESIPPENIALKSTAPENAAPENTLPATAAPDPVAQRNPKLAFGIRLTASDPPATPQPAAAAQSSPSQGNGSATPGNDSAADRVTSPAAQNKPPVVPNRQPADDGIQARDPDSPPPEQAEQSEPATVETKRPAFGQGASSQPRDPESRRPLASAASSESGSAVAVSAAAPAASPQPASRAPGSAPRTAAPPAPAPPEAPSEPPREPAVRELSLSVSGPSVNGRAAGQVSLRVVERGGEVQVAVRTTDSQLAGDLRQNLPDLVSELSGRGYRTETWQPLAGSGADASALPRASSTAADSSAGQSYSGQAGDGSRNGGSPAGQQQQQQRHGQDPSQPSWLQALTRSAAQTRSTPYDDHTR